MLIGKALVQDEVIVAFKGVAIDTGIAISVIGNQFLQFHGSFGQRFDGEGNVLDQTRGAYRTSTSHTGEDTASDSPVFAIDGRILGKHRWDIESELSQTGLDLLYLLQQLLVGNALCLCQYRRQVVIVAWFHTFYLTCIHIFLILQEDGIIY